MARRANAKFDELRALDAEGLAKEREEAHRQLFTLRLQVATRQLQDVKTIGKVRRKIARIRTLQHQRQLAGGAR